MAAAVASSTPVVTMAALLLLLIASMAVHTTAARPAAADAYSAPAAPTTAKPGYDAAPSKVAEKTAGGEAAAAKPAEAGYVAADTKPVENTATAVDLVSGMAKTAVGDKVDAKDVTAKDTEALLFEIEKMTKPMVAAGDYKVRPSYSMLQTAKQFLVKADESLKKAATAASPEKSVAGKKAAGEDYTSALMYIASARAESVLSAAGGVKAAAKPATDAYAVPEAAAGVAKDLVKEEAAEGYIKKKADAAAPAGP